MIIDMVLILRQIKVLSSDDSVEDDADPIAQLEAAFVNMTLELSRLVARLGASEPAPENNN